MTRPLLAACALALAGCGGPTAPARTPPLPRDLLALPWYLPPHFSKRADAIVVAGDGKPLGKLYAHTSDIAVKPGGLYRASVSIDARSARGKICYYLAERPSGRGLDIGCAVTGTIRRYSISSIVPSGVSAVAWVAFVNGGTVQAGKVVTYVRPELAAAKPPIPRDENLFSP